MNHATLQRMPKEELKIDGNKLYLMHLQHKDWITLDIPLLEQWMTSQIEMFYTCIGDTWSKFQPRKTNLVQMGAFVKHCLTPRNFTI